ncbi:MAG: zinc dependent phospholipase C family protein, partial [Clostridia bacterium]|nr:zinc dependent phospholipase C family protein [Clostridia bacterium]
MASWMVHLRIADKLLDRIPDISPIEFIVGNIAPDSGVPNADWSAFSPPTNISHFKTEGQKACPDAFAAKYFTAEQRQTYNPQPFSFYLGYLTHLITDMLWSENIVYPTLDKYAKADAPDREDFIWKIKEDWYDLDFKYLRDRPGFRAFRAYLGAVGFRNTFMEEFSPDAFDDRRQYITAFYLEPNDHIDREYPYLTEKEMDAFV